MDESFIGLLANFILRLSEALCFCYFLSPLTKRFEGWTALALQAVGFGVSAVAVRWLTYQFNWEAEYVFMTFIYYSLVYLLIIVRFQTRKRDAVFYLVLIFLCVHAMRLLVNNVFREIYGSISVNDMDSFIRSLLSTGLLCSVLYFEFSLLKKPVFRYPNRRFTWSQLALLLITIVPVFYITNIGLVMGSDQAKTPISAAMISVVCSLCGMVVCVSYNNTLALSINRQEMVRLETLLATQHKQYQLKKETTELINQRYHDLKRHFNYLATIDSPAEREKYMDAFRLEINPYDALHDTGCETLDIVLTDKDMECRRRGISLLLFVDGAELRFLEPLDIVTIFGNAIDNVIEAVEQLSTEQRIINVQMRKYDTWLAVSFENAFDGTLKWEQKQLATTKGDEDCHGYGIINIKTAVEKYGGNMTVDGRGVKFVLTVLFPLNR